MVRKRQMADDGTLFRHAVSEAKFALENSELIAILWHQGENDSSAGKYKEYYKKLEIIVEEFRNTLGQVPFIIGGLGDYLGKTAFGAHCTEYELVNRELYKFIMKLLIKRNILLSLYPMNFNKWMNY